MNTRHPSVVTRSHSRALDDENGGDESKVDVASSESDDDIIPIRRKRPQVRVADTSESSSLSDENSKSPGERKQAQQIGTETPARSMRDRRKTSSSKKQKIMELKRLQRIRKRQSEKRAQRQPSIEDNPVTTEAANSTADVNIVTLESDSDNDEGESNAAGADLQGHSPWEVKGHSQVVTYQLNCGSKTNTDPNAAQLASIDDVVVIDDDIPEDEIQLIQTAVMNSYQEQSGNHSPGQKNTSIHDNNAGSDSSGSDIMQNRSRVKKFNKSFIESEDDENSCHSNQRNDVEEDSSENSGTGDDDVNEDGDLAGFVVDDDEELDEHFASDQELIDEELEEEEEENLKDAQLKFVVEKDLLSTGDDIVCIWSVEGKTMRKYVSQTDDADHHDNNTDDEDGDPPDIFERTSETCHYSNKDRSKYQPIDVCRYEADDLADEDNTDMENERVEVVSWDTPFDDEPISSQTVLPMLTGIFAGGLRQVFEIYLQAILSAAVDPEFLVSIYQEKDDYFLPALHKVDDELNDRKTFLVKSQAWVKNYKKSIEKYPHMEDTQAAYVSEVLCEACKLSGRHVSVEVSLGGKPYNRNTLETVESSEDSDSSSYSDAECPLEGEKRYLLGRFCFKRSKLYHKLHHYKWNLFQECIMKVEFHRLVRPETDRNHIIELVMDDDNWIQAMYGRLKHTLDCAYEYTTDGKSDVSF